MTIVYNRSIDELERYASLWWPTYLVEMEANTSIVPLLIRTQDNFISILNLAQNRPEQIFDLIIASEISANVFLKHLVVLSDYGGEQIQRLNSQFNSVFDRNGFDFIWRGNTYTYNFQSLPVTGVLNNAKLRIDSKGLTLNQPLNDMMKDLIMIVLFGASAVNENTAEVLNKCEIGTLLGNGESLERYIKQKYIWVSRITGGATANNLGQVAQNYIIDFLRDRLGTSYDIVSNGHIAGITHNDGRTLTTFDITVSKNNITVAIEISFQVTTNSTIERKAGQASSRYNMVQASGNYIAYVIDGAGNFQRRSAVSTICENSHCTIAYTREEFEVLVDFIREKTT